MDPDYLANPKRFICKQCGKVKVICSRDKELPEGFSMKCGDCMSMEKSSS